MSLSYNLQNQFVPVREQRRTATITLQALNAEVIHNLNGDESAIISMYSGGATFNATYEITGTVDGVNYFSVLTYPLFASAGTVPVFSQPLVTEAINAANVVRILCVGTTGLVALRVRLSAYTAGAIDVIINSDPNESIHPHVQSQRASTLFISTTAAVSVAATATLPAVAGLRHYVDFVKVTRSATAALTAAATPVLVTTTNLPGSPVITFGSDAGGIGVDKEYALDFGSTGLAASAIGTATTVVCPVYTNVIWRVNVAYRLGL